MPYIGIDFGTSNSVVANFQFGRAEVVPNHEGQKWTPSIVTMRRDGTLSFGQEAKENPSGSLPTDSGQDDSSRRHTEAQQYPDHTVLHQADVVDPFRTHPQLL